MNPTSTSTSFAAARRSVLILGANGRLGCAAAQAFDAAGWRVFAHVRRSATGALPARAVPVRADLTDAAVLAREAAGASVVVHAVNPAYTRWDAEALPALRHGMAVAELLDAHFMLPGNVYNFGAQMPPLLRATTPHRPTTRKGEIRVAMEAELRERGERHGLRAAVLRAGDFFGAGAGNWFDQAIVKSLAAGKLVYPGPLDVAHAWAYLPDLARAFVAVAERGLAEAGPAGLRDLPFAGHTLTGAQLLAGLEQAAAALGVAPRGRFRHGGVPWGVMRAVGTVYPLWRELASMAYLWEVPHALDGNALAALPGMPAPTPIDAALRASLLALGHGLENSTDATSAPRHGGRGVAADRSVSPPVNPLV